MRKRSAGDGRPGTARTDGVDAAHGAEVVGVGHGHRDAGLRLVAVVAAVLVARDEDLKQREAV